MSILDIILAIISIVSFVFAVLSYVKTEIKKANERANVEIMNEKLKALHQGLESLFHTADAIVQIPKHQEVKVEELQNIARVLRGQIYVLSEKIRKSSKSLENWQFGKMIKSEPINNVVPEVQEDNKQTKNNKDNNAV